MVKDMCKDANVYENFTNHSLHATGVTVLFNGGVTEHLIYQRTGHKSLGALQFVYMRGHLLIKMQFF